VNSVLGWFALLIGAAVISSGVNNVNFFTEMDTVFKNPRASIVPGKQGANTPQPPNQDRAHPTVSKATTTSVASAAATAVLV